MLIHLWYISSITAMSYLPVSNYTTSLVCSNVHRECTPEKPPPSKCKPILNIYLLCAVLVAIRQDRRHHQTGSSSLHHFPTISIHIKLNSIQIFFPSILQYLAHCTLHPVLQLEEIIIGLKKQHTTLANSIIYLALVSTPFILQL